MTTSTRKISRSTQAPSAWELVWSAFEDIFNIDYKTETATKSDTAQQQRKAVTVLMHFSQKTLMEAWSELFEQDSFPRESDAKAKITRYKDAITTKIQELSTRELDGRDAFDLKYLIATWCALDNFLWLLNDEGKEARTKIFTALDELEEKVQRSPADKQNTMREAFANLFFNFMLLDDPEDPEFSGKIFAEKTLRFIRTFSQIDRAPEADIYAAICRTGEVSIGHMFYTAFIKAPITVGPAAWSTKYVPVEDERTRKSIATNRLTNLFGVATLTAPAQARSFRSEIPQDLRDTLKTARENISDDHRETIKIFDQALGDGFKHTILGKIWGFCVTAYTKVKKMVWGTSTEVVSPEPVTSTATAEPAAAVADVAGAIVVGSSVANTMEALDAADGDVEVAVETNPTLAALTANQRASMKKVMGDADDIPIEDRRAPSPVMAQVGA